MQQCNSSLSKGGKISIVHIGDSHIQADYFSGRIRELLQYSFGNGGRGLVFPYRTARTNNPENYKVQWGGQWEGCRNVQTSRNCEIALTGVMSYTTDSSAYFMLNPNTNPALNYDFTRARLFARNGSGQMHFYLKEDSVNLSRTLLVIEDSACISLGFEKPQQAWNFFPKKTDTSRREFSLLGISLENDSAGLLYHMAGVNGAQYASFLGCRLFSNQLHHLDPQLVILSLGTNEGFDRLYDETVFRKSVQDLVDRIRETQPGVSILITMPGESMLKRRYPIKRHIAIRNVLYEVAREKNCAVWDLYQVMGGVGSMKRWRLRGLAAKDMVHYNAAGYRLQGELLYTALLNYYEKNRNR